METGEIQDSLNEISNADAEKIIKEAKKESKGDPDRVLAEKLQKFLPDVKSISKIERHIQSVHIKVEDCSQCDHTNLYQRHSTNTYSYKS